MIIVVGGIKGGGGKTTLATNLAVKRSTCKKILLVDADEIKSASDWASQREALKLSTDFTTVQLSGKNTHSQIQKLEANYDDIIVDVGGRDTTSQRSVLTIADIFLVPFKPSSIDIWTINALNTMLADVYTVNQKLKCFGIINQADPIGTDNQDALDVIKELTELECIPFFIVYRKAYRNAAAEGFAIHELKNKDKKANDEMNMLYNLIFKDD